MGTDKEGAMPEEIRPNAAYSVAQVAELLGFGVHRVYDAVQGGELRAYTPNGCKKGMRIMGAWLLDWMEKGAARAGE